MLVFPTMTAIRSLRACPPNDPYYVSQWHYGQTNSPAAWDTATGTLCHPMPDIIEQSSSQPMVRCGSRWAMPRLARLDAPAILHHVMIRGIERRKIFRDAKDREIFLGHPKQRDVLSTGPICPCKDARFVVSIGRILSFTPQEMRDLSKNMRKIVAFVKRPRASNSTKRRFQIELFLIKFNELYW